MARTKAINPINVAAAAEGAVNLANEVPFDGGVVVEQPKKEAKLNIIDRGIIIGANALVQGVDFLVDDIICGGLPKKIKSKASDIKGKIDFKRKGWRALRANEKATESDTVMVPATIDVTDKDLFSIQEDPDTAQVTNIMLNNIIKKYKYSDKLLATAILWLCDKIDEAQVGAVVAGIDTDETSFEKFVFINSITMYFGDIRFAAKPEYTDIEFAVNADALETVVRDLSHLDILRNNEKFSDIITKAKEYIKSKTNKSAVIFDNSKLNINATRCPQEVVKKIEAAYGDILAECGHSLNQLPNGLVELRMFKSEDQTDIYTIDPGVIFAGDVKMLVTDVNGNDFFTSNIPLIRKFILNNSYRVAMEDVPEMLINEHQFLDQTLMINYDFTNINAKMKEMTIEDMSKLEAKLNYIRAEVIDRFKVSPRMKIKNFKSIDSFQVSSDNKIPSPMEEMTKEVINGLTIKVKKDEYTFELRDENGNLTNQDKVTMDYSVVVQLASGTVDINAARQLNNTIKVQNTVNGTK